MFLCMSIHQANVMVSCLGRISNMVFWADFIKLCCYLTGSYYRAVRSTGLIVVVGVTAALFVERPLIVQNNNMSSRNVQAVWEATQSAGGFKPNMNREPENVKDATCNLHNQKVTPQIYRSTRHKTANI